jgi:hypothetical protein
MAYIGRWQTNMDAARTILANNDPMHIKKILVDKRAKALLQPFKVVFLSFLAVTGKVLFSVPKFIKIPTLRGF